MGNPALDYYKDYYKLNGYKGSDNSKFSRFAFIRKWINENLKDDACILDIGCGDAAISRDIVGKYQYFGIDINIEKSVAHSVKKHNLEEFPYPYDDEFFDCIICSEFIEHVFDPVSILKEANRLLKADGFLILSTPNINWIDYKMHPEQFSLSYKKHMPHTIEHIRHYDHESIGSILDDAGFKAISYTGADAHYSPFFSIARAVGLKKLFNEEVQIDEKNCFVQTENMTMIDMLLGEQFPFISHTMMFLCKKAT